MANTARDEPGAVSGSLRVQLQPAVKLQCTSDKLPQYRKSVKELEQSVSCISSQCQRAKSSRSCLRNLMPALSLEQRTATTLRNDLAGNMSSLADLGELSPDHRSVRNRTLNAMKRMAQQVDASTGKLGCMKSHVVEKLREQAAWALASRACKQLALSIGIVLEAILVYLPPRQHFSTALALTQPGGAKADIAAIRMKQVVRPLLTADHDGAASINSRMRAVLIDWLVEVHTRLHIQPDTFHVTVNVIERYLSQRCVSQSQLQLVGAAALLMARQLEDSALANLRTHLVITEDIIRGGPHIINPITQRQHKQQAKKTAFPPHPSRPHGGKLQRRAGILAQPGGRQRGQNRRAMRV